MLEFLNLDNVLFLDIETVPAYAGYEQMPDNFKKLWSKKAEFIHKKPEDTPATLYSRSGIFAEFGKIICISTGVLKSTEKKKKFVIKSFYGDDEKKVLTEFAQLLNLNFNKKENLLCSHNGKEFDYPFLSRRMMIHGVKLPLLLDLAGKKPWEVSLIDTMELWKFGDYKNYTSLELLAAIFNIPTPKDDIEGSDIARVYYEEKNMERIVNYCQKDVMAVARLLLRYQGKEMFKDEDMMIS